MRRPQRVLRPRLFPDEELLIRARDTAESVLPVASRPRSQQFMLARVGIDLAYFAADSDGSAAEAGRRPGGPLGWPAVTGRRRTGLFRTRPVVVELGPVVPGFAARGYDPVVTLGTLEELLTGRPYDDLDRDPRWGATPSPEDDAGDDTGVVCLTDSLRDVLAHASDDRLAQVVGPWSRTEELQVWEGTTTADHLAFLRRLRDLARSATAGNQRLYCYVEA